MTATAGTMAASICGAVEPADPGGGRLAGALLFGQPTPLARSALPRAALPAACYLLAVRQMRRAAALY